MSLSLKVLKEADRFYLNHDQAGALPFINRNVTTRVMNFAALILSPLSACVEIPLGALVGVGALLTGGTIPSVNRFFSCRLSAGEAGIAAIPYVGLLKTINPSAKFAEKCFAPLFIDKLFIQFEKLRSSENLALRHVVSRLFAIAATIVTVVLRIFSFLSGAVMIPLSLLTLGNFEFLNTHAAKALTLPLVVFDILNGLIYCINPWADFES